MTSNNQLQSVINLSRSLFLDGGLIDSGSVSLADAVYQVETAIASLGLDEDSFTSLVAERGL